MYILADSRFDQNRALFRRSKPLMRLTIKSSENSTLSETR
jgi:hypothetical protein